MSMNIKTITDIVETEKKAKENNFKDFGHIPGDDGCFATSSVGIKGFPANYYNEQDKLSFRKRGIEVHGGGEGSDYRNEQGWESI